MKNRILSLSILVAPFLLSMALMSAAHASGAAKPVREDFDYAKFVGHYSVEGCVEENGKIWAQNQPLDITQGSATQLKVTSTDTYPSLERNFDNINLPANVGKWDNGWSDFVVTTESYTVLNGIFDYQHTKETPKSILLGFSHDYESRATLTDLGDGHTVQYLIEFTSRDSDGSYNCKLLR